MKSTSVWNSIKKYIILIVLGVFTLVLATNYFINNNKISKRGVYVLGRVIDKGEYRAGASSYKYEYFFKNKRYQGKTVGVGLGNVGSLFFVQLIPSDPNNHNIMEFTGVPSCLTLDSVPQQGWKELPLNKCK